MSKVTYTQVGNVITGSDGSRRELQKPPVTQSKTVGNVTPGSIAEAAVKQAMAKVQNKAMPAPAQKKKISLADRIQDSVKTKRVVNKVPVSQPEKKQITDKQAAALKTVAADNGHAVKNKFQFISDMLRGRV